MVRQAQRAQRQASSAGSEEFSVRDLLEGGEGVDGERVRLDGAVMRVDVHVR
jgi:hypothetical protein